MANVYVEACPKGYREGTPITNFVVEEHAGSAILCKARTSIGVATH